MAGDEFNSGIEWVDGWNEWFSGVPGESHEHPTRFEEVAIPQQRNSEGVEPA